MAEVTAEVASETAEGRGADGDLHIVMVPPCRLAVKATAGARVVGKGGEAIRAIRASSNATVRVFQDELPEVLRRRDENLVVASCGEASSLRAAVSSILERIFDRSGLPDHAERERERPYVVDVVVPERAAGPLVGPGGERVKALIDELGCSIDVVREPLAGIAAQRRVRVLSRDQARAEEAVWRIQDILSELIKAGTLTAEHFELREALPTEQEKERLRHASTASGGEVPMRLALTPNEAAVVVGKMGFNVRRLRDIAAVSVDDAEVPGSRQREAICTVSRASLEDRLRVIRIVLTDLSTSSALRRGDPVSGEGALPDGSRPVATRLLLPVERWSAVAGALGGSMGACPSTCDLSVETSAEISTHEWGPVTSIPMHILEVKGTEDQVAAAIWRLHQLLEPWEPAEVPPRKEIFQRPADAALPDDGAGKAGATAKGSGKGTGKRPQTGEPILPARRPPPPDAVDRASFTHAPSAAVPENTHDFEKPALREEPPWLLNGAPAVQQSAQVVRDMGAPIIHSRSSRNADEHAAEVHSVSSTPERTCTLPNVEQPSPISRVVVPTHPERPRNIHEYAGEAVPSAPATALHAAANAAATGDCQGSSLMIQVPSVKIAAFLVSEASGVAKRSGVTLRICSATDLDGRPIVEIAGALVGIAVACYLVQEQMWLASSF